MMVADRQIVKNQGGKIEVTLPDYISSEEVEVILIAVERKSNSMSTVNDISELYGKLHSGLTMEEIDAEIYQMRAEWDRDI